MATDAIHEYLARSRRATLQMAGGAEALAAAVHQRWSVKTGADSDSGNMVGQAPTPTAIANLCALAVPAILPPDGRSAGAEQTVWQLNATLAGYKLESDGDYHLVIADDQGNTMIAEIPDPAQLAAGSFFAQQITAARQAFDSQFGLPGAPAPALTPAGAIPTLVQVTVPVTLVGLGFFDFLHGQDGVAPNGIELHPVISIQFQGQAPAAPPSQT